MQRRPNQRGICTAVPTYQLPPCSGHTLASSYDAAALFRALDAEALGIAIFDCVVVRPSMRGDLGDFDYITQHPVNYWPYAL